MQRATLRKLTDFAAKRSQWVSLALSSGVVILGGLSSLWLLPSHPAMSQSQTFHGLVLAQSQSAESFYKQGMAKLQRKDYRGAGSDFNEALRLKPNYAEAYYGRGRVRYFLDDDRGAILDFNEAIRLKPNYAEAYYGRARAHQYVKAYKASSNDFLTALRLKPDYAKQPDLWNDFGQLLLSVGENKNALNHFNEAIRLQSNHADAHYGRAVARYRLNGDLAAFINELEKTARLYREQGNTQSFSETVAEINRARAHLNQQDDDRVCRNERQVGINDFEKMTARQARGYGLVCN